MPPILADTCHGSLMQQQTGQQGQSPLGQRQFFNRQAFACDVKRRAISG